MSIIALIFAIPGSIIRLIGEFLAVTVIKLTSPADGKYGIDNLRTYLFLKRGLKQRYAVATIKEMLLDCLTTLLIAGIILLFYILKEQIC